MIKKKLGKKIASMNRCLNKHTHNSLVRRKRNKKSFRALTLLLDVDFFVVVNLSLFRYNRLFTIVVYIHFFFTFFLGTKKTMHIFYFVNYTAYFFDFSFFSHHYTVAHFISLMDFFIHVLEKHHTRIYMGWVGGFLW